MKKILSLFVLTVSLLTLNAQVIGISPNDSVSVSANVADEFDPVDAHIHIYNYLKGATSYTWMMKDYVAPSQWELKLCDNNNCYDLLLGNPVHESLEVATGDSMDMKFQFSPHCVDGFASANILIYVTGDSSNTAITLNYQANLTTSCLNSINTLTTSNIKLYPNPVKNTFVVSGLENAGNVSFDIFDMKGALVKSEVIGATNNGFEISIANVAAGDYVLKAIDSKGMLIASAKLQKID